MQSVIFSLLLGWAALDLGNSLPDPCRIDHTEEEDWMMKCNHTAGQGLAAYMEANPELVFGTLTVEFADVPQLPLDLMWKHQQQLHTFEVRHSNLRVIGEDAWSRYSIVKIDLSYNNIESINPACFRGMTALKKLFLNNNRLATIEKYALYDLTGLQELSLSSNYLTNMYTLFPANLTSVDLSDNPLRNINPDVFQNAHNLQRVDISNIDLQNVPTLLKVLPENLVRLEMRHTNVSHLTTDTFGTYSSLHTLDLSYNTISLIDENVFSYFPNLYVLFRSHNNLQIIPKDIKVLKNLQYLDLSNNQITSFDGELLSSLSKLTNLYLSNNPLRYDDQIRKIYGLKVIRLEAVGLDEKSPLLGLLQGQLLELHLANNNITVVNSTMFVHCSSLQILDLSYNLIRHIKTGSFARTTHLQTLLLQGNRLATISPKLFSMTSLKSIDLSSNDLTEVPVGTFDSLVNLTDLNLSDNREITVVDGDMFAKTTRLSRLCLRGNKISGIPSRLFLNTPLLQYLDLSDNRLRTISIGSFDRLQLLVYLNMSLNRLETVDEYSLYPLSNLRKLYLHGNRLQKVDGLGHLWKTIDKVSLEDNDWRCESLLRAIQALKIQYDVYRPSAIGNATHQLKGIPCTPEDDQKTAAKEEDDDRDDLALVAVVLLAIILVVAFCMLLIKIYKVVCGRRELVVLTDEGRSIPNDYRHVCKAEDEATTSSDLIDEKNSIYNGYEIVA